MKCDKTYFHSIQIKYGVAVVNAISRDDGNWNKLMCVYANVRKNKKRCWEQRKLKVRRLLLKQKFISTSVLLNTNLSWLDVISILHHSLLPKKYLYLVSESYTTPNPQNKKYLLVIIPTSQTQTRGWKAVNTISKLEHNNYFKEIENTELGR